MINVKILCCIFSAFSPTTALTHVSLYTSVVSGPDTTFYCTWAYQLLPMNIDADAGRRHTDVAIKYLNEVRCHSATTCTYKIPNKRPRADGAQSSTWWCLDALSHRRAFGEPVTLQSSRWLLYASCNQILSQGTDTPK